MPLRGTTQTLTAVFYDSPGGPIEDPLEVSLSIYLNGTLVHGPIGFPPIIRDGVGLYRYEYAIPITAEPGTYTVAWTSLQPGDSGPSVGYDTFEVTTTIPGVPGYGGCVWPIDPACQTAEWLAFDESVRTRALRLASSTLERLSGYRVGNCPTTVRPSPQSGTCASWMSSNSGGGGYWAAVRTSQNGYGHSRDPERGIRLPAPVGRVDQVKVDGTIVDPLKYHVERNLLIWHSTDPNPFPMTQNLDLLDTEPGTFSVTYLNAYPVDSLGAYAVGVLALEFAKACSGNKCRLPDSVTSIVRQGVAMEIRTGTFPDGTTGIREVDAWIGLYNPGNLRRAVGIYSPDLPRTAITTVTPR